MVQWWSHVKKSFSAFKHTTVKNSEWKEQTREKFKVQTQTDMNKKHYTRLLVASIKNVLWGKIKNYYKSHLIRLFISLVQLVLPWLQTLHLSFLVAEVEAWAAPLQADGGCRKKQTGTLGKQRTSSVRKTQFCLCGRCLKVKMAGGYIFIYVTVTGRTYYYSSTRWQQMTQKIKERLSFWRSFFNSCD